MLFELIFIHGHRSSQTGIDLATIFGIPIPDGLLYDLGTDSLTLRVVGQRSQRWPRNEVEFGTA